MRLLVTLAIASSILAVLACGGDDDDEVTPTPTVTPTASGPIIPPTTAATGTTIPTSSPDLALQQTPEGRAIRQAITDYVAFINDEDWDGMCAMSSASVREAPGLCEGIRTSIVTAASNQGVSEGEIDATVDDIVVLFVRPDQARARYTFCIVLNNTPNCTFPTVNMVLEADGWKVGYGV